MHHLESKFSLVQRENPKPVLGKVEGSISKRKKGKNGFGYDPIFIPNGSKVTYGQMKYSEKIKIDHRFKAFKKIKKFF